MKVLFACGGTGGHINPAIAIAKTLKERHPEAEIWFAGASNGMEAKLVPAEGFKLKTVDVEGFQRKISLQSVPQNIRAARKVLHSLRWAKSVLDDLKPDIAVGTGGYASFPILYSAAKRGIPTVIHEANAYPGLTTRVLARYADRVLLNFEASREYFKDSQKVKIVGMPIREDMIFTKREEARAKLNLDERPLIVSFWGSLGAREMNRYMAEFISLESNDDRYQHIHATGKFGYEWMPELLRENGVDLKDHPNIELREYISDMPRVMAAADLVMCRAGASTLCEITALAKPAIIVPSPNVTANHQVKNARVLENAGAAVVIPEEKCTPQLLYKTAVDLLENPKKLNDMSNELQKMAILDATDRIYKEILALYKNQ